MTTYIGDIFDKLMRLREIPEPHFFIDILLPFVLD